MGNQKFNYRAAAQVEFRRGRRRDYQKTVFHSNKFTKGSNDTVVRIQWEAKSFNTLPGLCELR